MISVFRFSLVDDTIVLMRCPQVCDLVFSLRKSATWRRIASLAYLIRILCSLDTDLYCCSSLLHKGTMSMLILHGVLIQKLESYTLRQRPAASEEAYIPPMYALECESLEQEPFLRRSLSCTYLSIQMPCPTPGLTTTPPRDHKENNMLAPNVCEVSHGNTNLGTILTDPGTSQMSVINTQSISAILEAIGREYSEFPNPSH